MRIIYDHQIFTWQTYGGISRYYYEIANRIAAMGNDVEIFSPFMSINISIKIVKFIPLDLKFLAFQNISVRSLTSSMRFFAFIN